MTTKKIFRNFNDIIAAVNGYSSYDEFMEHFDKDCDSIGYELAIWKAGQSEPLDRIERAIKILQNGSFKKGDPFDYRILDAIKILEGGHQ